MRKNKYNAVKTEVDGITFDSKKEARRYGTLKLLQKAGEIRNLQCHVKFNLSILNDCESKSLLGHYEADFVYWDVRNKRHVVEDVKTKATLTPLYRWKKKHFEIQYAPLKITEVFK